MPIYEYRCHCGHQFEKLCPMSDAPVQPCPKCGGEARKVLSVFQMGRSSGSFDRPDFSPGNVCGSCQNSSCAWNH